VGERFASQAFEQETADGDAVGGEQGGEIEREDGVEGGGRADVDEGEQDADDEGDDDGVEGDCGFGVDLVGVLLALSLLTHARRVSILTWLTVAEKGTPLSLANAQVWRLAVATHAITLPVMGKMTSIVMAIVAALLPVVL
jgi:hypothetical protein